MEFLDEAGARTEITALLSSTIKARIAVAFWGKGAISALGLDRPGLDLQVLCNLDSGACNPDEISALRKLIAVPASLKALARLHAKVYWTPDGVVVGSSNASSNGLAVEGEKVQSWSEANMLIRDPLTIAQIEGWFQAQFYDGYAIEDRHIATAKEVWEKRKRAAPAGQPLTHDLIEAYRNDRENAEWCDVRVILWSEPINQKGEAEKAREVKARPALINYDCYQDWKEIEEGEQIIEFKVVGRKGQFTGYFESPRPKIESANLTFVREVNGIRLANSPLMGLMDSDRLYVEANMAAILALIPTGNEKWGRVALADFIAALDQVRDSGKDSGPADEKAFRSLMWNTYEKGKSRKMPLDGFRNMLERHGGLETAHHLLAATTEQSGLIGLYHSRKLHLSVEALVLRPEWRSQFSDSERAKARKRLSKYRCTVHDNGTVDVIYPADT